MNQQFDDNNVSGDNINSKLNTNSTEERNNENVYYQKRYNSHKQNILQQLNPIQKRKAYSFAQQSQDQNPLIDTNLESQHIYYQIQKQRKQKEKIAEQLTNRIALLKQEEQRFLRKIQETRTKALEIYLKKLKKEQINQPTLSVTQSKRQLNGQVVENPKKQIQSIVKIQVQPINRNIRFGSCNASVGGRRHQAQQINNEKVCDLPDIVQIEDIKEKKKQNAKLVKLLSQSNEKKIQDKNESYIIKAKKNKQIIKEQQIQAKAKIQEFQSYRRQQVKQEIQEKFKREQQAYFQYDNEVKVLEQYETDLIIRLHETQNIQKSLVQELDQAQILSADDFANKYLRNQTKNNSIDMNSKSKQEQLGFYSNSAQIQSSNFNELQEKGMHQNIEGTDKKQLQ